MAKIDEITKEERVSAWKRMIRDASDRLAVGPIYALVGATLSVFCLGVYEGTVMLKPVEGPSAMSSANGTTMRYRFSVRFGLAQILPSIVRLTQPAMVVAKAMGVKDPSRLVYSADNLPSRKVMQTNRLLSIRASIAGSVILSQVIALTTVITAAKETYGERIIEGKEPPLHDRTQTGVVVRFAGEVSDVTSLTMNRIGRRKIFPIFETAQTPHVQDLVNEHGNGTTGVQRESKPDTDFDSGDRDSSWWSFFLMLFKGNSGKSHNNTQLPHVPVFWQVDNGRYSLASSWKGMHIPTHWLFDNNKSGRKLLVLEADASPDEKEVWSLSATQDELDLDLYEIAQGFTKLSSLVSSRDHEILRVVLVNAQAPLEMGGGGRTTIRKQIEELGLSDVVVDYRAPLVAALVKWLSTQTKEGEARKKSSWFVGRASRPLKPVVLETPHDSWFESLSAVLEMHGYQAFSRSEAIETFGSVKNLPFLVYQNTTADAIHTVHQHVSRGLLHPNQVCILCGAPLQDDLLDLRIPGVTQLSSSDLYDRLFAWVRHRVVDDGDNAETIQQQLDKHLDEILLIS